MKQIGCLAAIVLLSIPASAQVVPITDFESFSEGQNVMFRAPRFSGSTTSKLGDTPNTAAVTGTFPGALPQHGSQVFNVSFSFADAATDPVWLRLTTFNAPEIPNPTVSFSQPLSFDLFSDRPIFVTLGLRETGTTADIGGNGGTSGSIEWVGGITDPSTSPPKGRLIPASTWTTLFFDIPNEPVKGFTGKDTLESATGKGVLEHLAFMPGVEGAEGRGTYNLFLDNFQVVPEPSTWVLALLSFGFLALKFRGRRN